jgi:hypothetical protein
MPLNLPGKTGENNEIPQKALMAFGSRFPENFKSRKKIPSKCFLTM